MLKRLMMILLLTVATAAMLHAVPALPGVKRTLTLADGTTVELTLCGDEHLHYWQAQDGRTFDDDGTLIAPAQMRWRRQAANRRRQAAAQRRMSRRQAATTRQTSTLPISNYTGEKKGLIILVEFTDLTFRNGHNQALYDRIANEAGFSNQDGFNGSIHDYFLDQSRGAFSLTFDVVGPVTLANGYAYYGKNVPYGNDTFDEHPGEMVVEACQAIADEVDFNEYDWDGDGEVDQVMVIYAGRGEASGGAKDTVWPHEWVLSEAVGEPLTLNGVTIDTYACSCELQSTTRIDGIGTTCHEFSHCLGLPDMYDINYSGNYGMSYWSLMSSGSYNGESFTPAGYTSFERMCCGWLTPTQLTDETEVTSMKALSDGGEAYILYNDAYADEFYLLENRQRTGWDAGLYASGMLILHVDYDEEVWLWNEVNTTSDTESGNDHQRCTIFHADNNTRSIFTAPYPYLDNDSLTATSRPAATLYHKNSEGTLLMNFAITGIQQNEDGTMQFNATPRATTDSSTAITRVTGNTQRDDRHIYSLDGRDMGTDITTLPHGIYIIKGKKTKL